MSFFHSLNNFHIDVLREIGNIGAGNAATALSKLLNKKIIMKVPDVRVASFNEMFELAGGADQYVASVFLRMDGKVTGSIFFVLPVDQATLFVRQMTGIDDFSFDRPPYPEIALSAFQEAGNILASSYLNALSDFIRLPIMPSVPEAVIDLFGAIISYGLLEISRESDQAIVIDTEIIDTAVNSGSIKGHIFLLPDPGSFRVLFDALGVGSE
ncbi:chemotaxis protein CheC [Caldibacillus debilis]|uniref:CheC-like protein domain-containing protein n=1 Tax=Caldibacillus debilis TaxID=301148 RepID=A0A150LCE3_9BACI|nr:chemotaxis protein CheC [Caldibacillus debilis]KYD09402.1 hypothetical protein B4135_3726 [Caldibacillus debilis]